MLDNAISFIIEFGKEFIPDLGQYLLKLILIVVAVVVALEILKAFKILELLNKLLYPLTKPLGISKGASMPLLIGFLAGLTYGAGAIIASYNNNEMTKKDVILVSTFLCLCHAILEDTLLFSTIGANGIVIVLARFLLAIISTIIVNIIYEKINRAKLDEKMEEENANN